MAVARAGSLRNSVHSSNPLFVVMIIDVCSCSSDIPPILELVDKKALALATAVEVSFLDHEVQQMLYEYMCENEICKTFQIFALRDYLKENDTITKMELMRILNENAPKDESNRFQQLTITKKKLQEYFPVFYTKSQMKKVLYQLLEEWKRQNNQSEE